jgi:CxxC motif-containing protein (DUF1111 family)
MVVKVIFKKTSFSTTLVLAIAVGLAGCEGPPGPITVREDPTDVPMRDLTGEEVMRFNKGDQLIETSFRDTDGLGPLFIETSCRSCHGKDSRGPGKVERMAIANTDGTTADSLATVLPYGTVVRRHTAAGATHPLLPPDDSPPGLLLSTRFGPALFARGRMEMIADQTMIDEAAHQAQAGVVSGRVNHMADGSLGRFGVKARVSNLDTFTADAFHGDMGLTTELFPHEFKNPDNLADDLVPGVDVPMERVADIAFYIRTLALPRREGLTNAGTELLQSTGCLHCHVNSYKTRSDAPVAALAGISADIYTDLLLHDLGTDLADGITDFEATGREWKTPPLVGLRFFKSFLHDGRAKTLDDAIRMHAGEGSEANFAVDNYKALSEGERQLLLDHLGKL